MSLATREQKAVVTDFCACRALWFFHAMKEHIKIRLSKERLTGYRGVYSKTISSIEYYTSITSANHLLGRTHGCAPTASDHPMKERIRIRIKQRKVHGPPRNLEQIKTNTPHATITTNNSQVTENYKAIHITHGKQTCTPIIMQIKCFPQ